MTFASDLDVFCSDHASSAEVKALESLSLTGMQPCFEDTILTLPVFVMMVVLAIYRAHQCMVAGKFTKEATFSNIASPVIQVLMCLVNAVVCLMILSKLDNSARFQEVVYPIGAAAWILFAFLNIYEQFYFSFHGQWVSRFCYLWIFVSWTIRWPTQSALASPSGQEFQFTYYLICWACQAVLIALMYFTKPVTADEVRAQQPNFVALVGEEDIELTDITPEYMDRSGKTVAEKLQLQKDAEEDYATRINRSVAEESQEMSKVTWTDTVNPEGEANFFSKLTFSWLSPMIAHARKTTIEPSDVFDLRAEFKSIDNFHYFEKIWLEEKAKHNAITDESLKESSHPLREAIKRSYGGYIARAGPLLLVQNVAQLTLPFLLRPLIEWLSPESDAPLAYGYYYSFGFFFALITMSTFENQYFNRVMSGGVKLRSSLVPTIFRHSLKLSNQARQERPSGAIVSHMSSDADKILLFCNNVHQLWSAPVRLLLGLALLIDGLGISGIVGFMSVVILIPIQGFVMKKGLAVIKIVMGKSDQRIKVCNEVLSGMRVIKYYAWEAPFHEKIEALRQVELAKLGEAMTWKAFTSFFITLNPVAMAVGTFVAFAFIDGDLSAGQAFQALTLFGQMLWPLLMLPQTFQSYFDTMISVDRIESFLLAETVDDPMTAAQAKERNVFDSDGSGLPVANPNGLGEFLRIADGDVSIKIENGTYSWNGSENVATLRDINLDIKPGSLTAIVGSTGSGKSSLIGAMIGEMQMKFGRAKMSGSFSYAPQQAWIYNATVKDNILFGLDYDEERYNRAIDGACLRKDIDKQFAAGDQTELGEKGINLSGGQRQRLNIARALYAQAEILILDDPLSALDPHVGSECFKNIKSLEGVTRVFACNQLHLASQFDRILVIQDGKILEDGTFEELHSKVGGEFHRLYDELGSVPEEKIAAKKPEKKGGTEVTLRQRKKSIHVEASKDNAEQNKKDVGKLVTAETHSVGAVKFDVYFGYLKSIGVQSSVAMIGGIALAQACQLATSQWLAYWSTESQNPGAEAPAYYVGIYAAISFSQVFFNFLANWFGYKGAVIGSSLMHGKFITGLMMSPISFFDSTPMGRITNRMSKDMNMIDNMIMQMLQMVIRAFIGLIGMLIIIGINTTYVLVAFVPILMIFSGVQGYYRSTAVQLKRLDAVTRSPIYAHFGECLGGMATIRAYGAQARMSLVNSQRLDLNMKIYKLTAVSNRWLSMRLEFLGGLLILATALNTVIHKGSIDPAIAGVSLSYALQITAQLNMLVRVVTEVEGMFNAVERVQEYMALPPEPPHEGPKTPPNWPDKGEIDIKDVVMSYMPGKPAVLRGLTLNIKPAEKIGVVGRTGAGKSSLFQALFRMMEPTSGTMRFDGIDLTGLGLDSVRKAISIIPQEPVLFSGTLRFNLDPFDDYSDMELWAALDKASLKKLLVAKGQDLSMEILEGGENFSVGQRQLVCLARALLKKSKILVLDEATANVDLETDALIQATIRENFADRTTLTIAHRLNTIIDCDKILVLELGTVLEFDTPKNLLSKDSEFAAMVKDTGPENEASLRAAAMGNTDVHEKMRREQEAAAALATAKLQNATELAWGPLMSSYRGAAATMKNSWEGRHDDNWEAELSANSVSQDTWMRKMSELLLEVNTAASYALEKEHLGLPIVAHGVYNNDRVHGTHDEM